MKSFTAVQRGTLTQAQERALIIFVTRLGRPRFAEYRRLAGVGKTSIPRLSRAEAWKLMQIIIKDLEATR